MLFRRLRDKEQRDKIKWWVNRAIVAVVVIAVINGQWQDHELSKSTNHLVTETKAVVSLHSGEISAIDRTVNATHELQIDDTNGKKTLAADEKSVEMAAAALTATLNANHAASTTTLDAVCIALNRLSEDLDKGAICLP